MKNRLFSLLTLAVVALAAPTTGRAQVISTIGANSTGTGYLGDETTGWAQTFQTLGGVAATLDSFKVLIDNEDGKVLNAFISEWAGPGASIPTQVMSVAFATATTSDVTFSNLNLALEANKSYAFYFTYAAINSQYIYPVTLVDSSAYPDGGAFLWQRADVFSVPSGIIGDYTGVWNLAFEATFSSLSPVPEPATYATIGLALCGVLAVVRRRRSAPIAPVATA
jgi:hypothetical protein